MNTLNYCFNHMRCGIFVMIRKSRVVIFAPFCNKDYVNTWGDQIEFDIPGHRYMNKTRQGPDKTKKQKTAKGIGATRHRRDKIRINHPDPV